MSGYDTNLAAEFHVLSVLHRLGCNASLTLGNKKSVDILLVRKSGRVVTIDVKGLAGATSWPVDNVTLTGLNHFLVFVCYLRRIFDWRVSPENIRFAFAQASRFHVQVAKWKAPRRATVTHEKGRKPLQRCLAPANALDGSGASELRCRGDRYSEVFRCLHTGQDLPYNLEWSAHDPDHTQRRNPMPD